ncbi:hypothetical protein BGZ68_008980 [Mortierella alpina]|nr:hypothetical protein BGZ68_008980 [Mortierella alpina]
MCLLYYGLLAYQALNPTSLHQELPAWLPRSDNTLPDDSMIIIPPMTSLLSFTYDSHPRGYCEDNPTLRAACNLTTVRQAQVYGVLHCSPQLEKLSLTIAIEGPWDTPLLAAAISTMVNLQILNIEAFLGFELIPTIVACCPPSLITLDISFESPSWSDYYEYELEGYKSEEEQEADAEAVRRFMPLLGQENGVLIVPRQGHLGRLLQLGVTDFAFLTVEEILSVFKQCPNLTNVYSLMLSRDVDHLDIVKCIGEHCPKVNRLVHFDSRLDPQLIMDVLSALPTHTVQTFICRGLDKSSTDLASRLLRHSASLCEISLHSYQHFSSKAIQSILVHCQALETFSCQSPVLETKFDLADAIELPWASTRLKCLRLLIAMDYTEHGNEGPFYKRLPLTNLTAAEYRRTIMLEKLYHQIGTLVNLDTLHMRLFVPEYRAVVALRAENETLFPGGRPDYPSLTGISFPGMLSLPRENSDRLGYLHLLAGLKKLRMLRGVTVADSNETIKLIEQPEVEWIAQNWSSLEHVPFFRDPQSGQPGPQPKPSCFLWLREQMPLLKMDLECNDSN